MAEGVPDFARAAEDYARYRAGFPAQLAERVFAGGWVRAGARVVDLGAGTGSLGRLFALRGCRVTGVDVAAKLLDRARALDREAGVQVQYVCAPAEATGLVDEACELVCAGQCWHWFDRPAAAREARRLLTAGGAVLIAHFDWIATAGNVVEATQEVLLSYTPSGDPSHGPWRYARGTGIYPQWLADLAGAGFGGLQTLSFDVDVPYSHEAWVGRLRASGPIGGTLPAERVAQFSRELEAILASRFAADEPLKVPHRCWAVLGRRL